MKKIFINYSRTHDSRLAGKLYTMLSAIDGFDVWMDKQDLQGGLQWRPAIRKAIREADFFISVLSANSVRGRGERNKEIYEALDVLKEFPPGEIYLVPVRVDDCIPPFEEMNALNRVDLFPDFDNGFTRLLTALGIDKPEKLSFEEVEQDTGSAYHYRVGMVDLDMGLVNLPDIASGLNDLQNYFLFTNPEMPALGETTVVLDGIKNFAVYKVPETYIAEHPHLGVDLIACITRYPLAFKESDYRLHNHFAGPSDSDERFLFLSADQLYAYCREAGCAFEEGIVSILTGQLMAYFTKVGYHKETRGCVMDYCEYRHDMVFGLKSRSVCISCLQNLPHGELRDSLLKLLQWKYRKLRKGK